MIQDTVIYLIGFMGAGKSTVAKELQQQYGVQLVEMDETIAAREGMPITDIFATKGEAYFRQKETALLGQAAAKGTVISCGGAICSFCSCSQSFPVAVVWPCGKKMSGS